MAKKSYIAIIIAIMIIISSIGFILIFQDEKTITDTNKEPKEKPIPCSYILQDFPYTGQKNSVTCYYAGLTMIFKYLGCDTNLEEILFYSGVGYSLIYQKSKLNNPPIPGFIISQSFEDMEFVASLYNSTSSFWYPSVDTNENKNWEGYWIRLKENISQDKPIITSVNPFLLPSFQKQFDIPNGIWDDLSPGAHAIVIVGYNESNNSVCFNDPAIEYFGDAKDGKYVWVKIDVLKEAVSKTAGTKFFILSFEINSKKIPKEIVFKKANKRNINKLKGIVSAYGNFSSDLKKFKIGIEAVKEFKNDLKFGLKYRTKTILSYKIQGMAFKKIKRNLLINSLILNIPYSEWSFLVSENNNFNIIAQDKESMYVFLKNSDYSKVKIYEAFKQESNYWNEIADIYDIFLKKGFMLTSIRANFLMFRINKLTDKIIDIQDEIISEG